MAGPLSKFGAERVGLCATCRHARVLETPRSVFWRCLLAAEDPRFDKYPRLPVIECIGYARVEPATPTEGG
jgi:hypothetical protein